VGKRNNTYLILREVRLVLHVQVQGDLRERERERERGVYIQHTYARRRDVLGRRWLGWGLGLLRRLGALFFFTTTNQSWIVSRIAGGWLPGRHSIH
jgi:hypothetical protein